MPSISEWLDTHGLGQYAAVFVENDVDFATLLLLTDDNLKELATLEPVGFDRTNFARFVGHKVSVSGQLVTSTEPPTMRVSSLDHIKNLSDICAPQ